MKNSLNNINIEDLMLILQALVNKGFSKEDARELLFNGKWRMVLKDSPLSQIGRSNET